MIHSHCHQKVLGGSRPSIMLLQHIPGAVVLEANSGCCGMAGSFGYEAEHADFSKRIANQRLVPSLEKEAINTIIVSNGFSCSAQISDTTKRIPLHVIKALRQFVDIEECP